LPKPTLKQ
jgi:hypothetical protein